MKQCSVLMFTSAMDAARIKLNLFLEYGIPYRIAPMQMFNRFPFRIVLKRIN